MEKTAKNMKIISIASKIAKALEEDTEEVLCDAEELVKKLPARYVKAALKKVEASLEEDGIEAEFDKTVSKEALRKTASVNYSAREIHDTLNKIAQATKDEVNESLAEGEEIMNKVVERFSKDEQPEVESKLKNIVEARLRNVGIMCRFDRVTYDPKASMKKAVAAIAAAKKKALAKQAQAKKTRRNRLSSRIR